MTDSKIIIKRLFKLKKPCADCPFMKTGIDLREGRLQGIKESLLADDNEPFICHKTLSREGANYDENNAYIPAGSESYCYGAMMWLMLQKSPNVSMRMGHVFGYINVNDVRQQAEEMRDKLRDDE